MIYYIFRSETRGIQGSSAGFDFPDDISLTNDKKIHIIGFKRSPYYNPIYGRSFHNEQKRTGYHESDCRAGHSDGRL